MCRLLRRLPLAALILSWTAADHLGAADPQLVSAPSAFLREHAATAVNWLNWGDAAFTRAQREQKPVYLAIGEFTSELSRAMAEQSFSSAQVAAFLNDNFVCVLVDANERPDLVALYQAYLRTTKQLSGLPMNLWLTPDLRPIDGATYLPPTEEWGKEGFFNAIKRIAAAWKADAAAQVSKAREATAAVAAAELNPGMPAAKDLLAKAPQLLAAATAALRAGFDADHGGFGDPPRYPEPELLRFLLRDSATRELAVKTLHAIVASPLRDPLDGGFFRYAQDAEWKQPYFQKTLADQARLVLALLAAADLTHNDTFAAAARGALAYALDGLGGGASGFAAAEDATPAKLSTCYLWTRPEVELALGSDAPLFCQNFGVTAEGNVPADAYPGLTGAGENLLYRATPPGDTMPEQKLAALCAKLLAARRARPAPRREDRAVAAAHGLILTALSRAGVQLREARFTNAARAEAAFIRAHLLDGDGGLRRLPDQPFAAAPVDYVLVIEGLRALAAVGEPDAGGLAAKLQKDLDEKFWDSGSYFAYPQSDRPGFWARVHAPLAPAHEPSAAAAMLASNLAYPLPADYASALAATLAGQLDGATDNPRGDLLLALQSTRTSE